MQLVIAILAGVVWWFTCIYYLMRAPEDVVHTWHIVVIAVPCAAITLGWHYGVSKLGGVLVSRYSRHISRMFAKHDLALQLLSPDMPEHLSRALVGYRPISSPRNEEYGALLGERIRLLLARFPAVCRVIGEPPWPPLWNALDVTASAVMGVTVLALALLDPLRHGLHLVVSAYAGVAVLLLAASAVKLEFVNARGAALAGAIADAFTPVADGRAKGAG